MQEELYTRVDIIKRCRREKFFDDFWDDVVETLEEYKEGACELLFVGIPTKRMPALLASAEEHVAYFAYLEMLRRELVPNRIPATPKGMIRQVVHRVPEEKPQPTVKARVHIGAGTPTSSLAQLTEALGSESEGDEATELAEKLASVPLPQPKPKPIPPPLPQSTVAKATVKSSGGTKKGTRLPTSIAGVTAG